VINASENPTASSQWKMRVGRSQIRTARLEVVDIPLIIFDPVELSPLSPAAREEKMLLPAALHNMF